MKCLHPVKVTRAILVSQKILNNNPSNVIFFTFESISTSFFSWLDPSTLMLSSFANSY